MNMQDQTLEKEIKELKNSLQGGEDTSPNYMGDQMQKLDHYISFTHTTLEESLGNLITRSILESLIGPRVPHAMMTPLLPEQQAAFSMGTATVAEIPYYPKVKMAYERKLIDGDMQSSMNTVNQYRNWFSHPSSYRKDLNKLKTDGKAYKKVLQDLQTAHNRINKVFS